MEIPMSKVYIQIDADNKIVRIEGGITTPSDLTGWILIDEGYGDKYNLCQTHYLEKGLITYDGIYQYKYVNNEVIERTSAEIEADRDAIFIVPSQMDLLEAQVMWTAVCTDTLLEEV